MMDIHTATELAYKNGYAKGFADGKGEVAREIFEEIETCLYRPFDDMPDDVHYQIREQDYDEIKKKYTEGVT